MGVPFLMTTAAFSLTAYLTANLLEKGLEKCDAFIATFKQLNFEGLFGINEIYRLKAQLLEASMNQKNNVSFDEIEKYYLLSLRAAQQRKLKLFELRTLSDLANLYLICEEQTKATKIAVQLQIVLNDLEPKCEEKKFSVIARAKSLVEQIQSR
eukprot:TRINITY_DN10716_c0_g1_i1.p2 TRINITY_DN10716_c0_g1~~TRINITY_DN10716_c0_g1_i1.p2  ORF type:complete len:154 (+),score=39.55 TRINITY_DN10716_c0_g1_i1:553-1014(+)